MPTVLPDIISFTSGFADVAAPYPKWQQWQRLVFCYGSNRSQYHSATLILNDSVYTGPVVSGSGVRRAINHIRVLATDSGLVLMSQRKGIRGPGHLPNPASTSIDITFSTANKNQAAFILPAPAAGY